MLVLSDLVIRFANRVAVAGIDLTVGDGEVVAVLGPSGSGKTTLLRAIAGLEPLAEGRVRWNSTDLAGVPTHRRRFGLMFQDPTLFPHRDVLANVTFGLRMQDRPRAEADARARELLELVGLHGADRRAVATLSGGEQQRVALARALAPAPRLLMLDEPFGALDRQLRERLAGEVRGLLGRLGVTALLVTHDHDEAFALADRVAILHAGHLEQVGAAEEVWHRPATEQAARFLGFTNELVIGGRRMLCRPDGLSLDPNGAHPGVVEQRTFRRDHFLVRVTVADGGALDVVVRDAPLPSPGDAVRVAVDSTAMIELP